MFSYPVARAPSTLRVASIKPMRSAVQICSRKSSGLARSKAQAPLTPQYVNIPSVIIGLLIGGGGAYYMSQRCVSDTNGSTRKATLQTASIVKYGDAEDFKKALQDLRDAFPDSGSVSTDPQDLWGYAQSVYSGATGLPHAVVVRAHTTEDVVKIVKISQKYLIPLVPYSGGTSLEGHLSAPDSRSICINLSGMNRILQVNESDADVVCQAGVTWTALNEELKERNIPLFLPLDPASGATIGGMIATGCSGTNAVRYGTARAEWFLNVTVVLPSGEVIKTRQRARKSSAGFDLTKLFIGAEGTLGIVTEATIRLAPLLPTTVGTVQFPDVRKATEAVCEFMSRSDRGIQCVELLDDLFMRAINDKAHLAERWPEKITLFLKYQGSQAGMHETSQLVEAVSKKHGGTGYRLARDSEEADELWAIRRNALFYAGGMRPEASHLGLDVCVPVSKLPDLIQGVQEDLLELGMIAPICGHVGDGNFHALLLYQGKKEMAMAEDIASRVVRKAIALEGTCTGEHGIGVRKRKYLPEELGEGTVELMRTIKRTIDPQNLFNPGKLYPDTPTK